MISSIDVEKYISERGSHLSHDDNFDDHSNYVFQFDSYWQYVQACKRQPIDPDVADSRQVLEDFSDPQARHQGTNTFDDAIEMAEYGWNRKFEAEDIALGYIKKILKPHQKQGYYNDVCGSIPDVAAYCAGRPEDMIEFVPVNTHKKVLSIAVNASAHWQVSHSSIITRGTLIYRFIDYLESQGYQCDLTAIFCCQGSGMNKKEETDNLNLIVKVPLKSAGHILTSDIIKFCLCSPAFVRRMYFSFKENEPMYFDKFLRFHSSGYGSAGEIPDIIGSQFDLVIPRNEANFQERDIERHLQHWFSQLDIQADMHA